MSDDEINDESEYVSKVLQYSQTEPAVSGKENWSMKWAIPKDCMFVHNSFKPSFIQ